MGLILLMCLFVVHNFALSACNLDDYWNERSGCYVNVPVIDPRTFSGEREFAYVTFSNTREKLCFMMIKNDGGILTFFHREIANDLLRAFFPDSVRRIPTSSNKNMSSCYGFTFNDVLFEGIDRVGFRSKGLIASPLFGLIVEPLEPHECPGSIFETAGGALITGSIFEPDGGSLNSGKIDFTKPFGPDYISDKFNVIASTFFVYVKGTAMPYPLKLEEKLVQDQLRGLVEEFRCWRDGKSSRSASLPDLLHPPRHHRHLTGKELLRRYLG